MSTVTDDLFKSNIRSSVTSETFSRNNPWFNDDCYLKRKLFLMILNRYRDYPTDENRQLHVKSRIEYKNIFKILQKKICR